MKRTQTIATCALGAVAAATLAFGLSAPQKSIQDPVQSGNGPSDVDVLKTKVAELEETVNSLTAWAEKQAEAGKELVSALERSEAEGFTAGINPKSREILLSGLRGAGEAMQASDSEGEKEEEPVSRRGRRRGK